MRTPGGLGWGGGFCGRRHDAGALLLGATDEASRLVDRFAACFTDGRAIDRIVHEVCILVVQRVFGLASKKILLANELDRMRRGRRSGCGGLRFRPGGFHVAPPDFEC